MSLLDRIDKDVIKALKAREQQKVTVLRGLKSDLKYRQIDKREELNEEDIINVLSGCAKKCRDSKADFERGNRDDLVAKTQFEIDIIAEYLPEQLSEDELRDLIKAAIEETGADSPQKMGLVMQVVMPKVRGRADGKVISKMATQMLAN